MLRQKASLALRWSGGIELCRIQRIVLPGALRVRRQRRLRGRTRRQHQHSVPRRQLALRHRRVETQASSPMSRRPRMHRRMETPKDGVAGFRIRVRGGRSADEPTQLRVPHRVARFECHSSAKAPRTTTAISSQVRLLGFCTVASEYYRLGTNATCSDCSVDRIQQWHCTQHCVLTLAATDSINGLERIRSCGLTQ